MNVIREIRNLRNDLQAKRESVVGLTFAEASESFNDIESLKLRIFVLRNPTYYADRAREIEERKAMRRGRRVS